VSEQVDEVRRIVGAALAAHDKPVAVRTAVEAVSSRRVSVEQLYRDVLMPLLKDIGGRWQVGERHVWEEHLASAAVRTIVELVYPEVLKARAGAAPGGRSVLLANPPEESHDLGLRMIADRFEMAGWTAYFLGADTPVEELVDAAKALRVDAVALGSSTHFHRLALRHCVDELKRCLPGVAVWVGGPAFARDREGWAADELLDLDALLREGSGHGEPPTDGEPASLGESPRGAGERPT